jgi:NAD(P)H-dependent FMN reductase
MLFQPLLWWRCVMPTERRRAVGFAEVLRWLTEAYADAERLVLVTDNLNTHTPACLYEAFAGAAPGHPRAPGDPPAGAAATGAAPAGGGRQVTLTPPQAANAAALCPARA